ncbi:MAG: HAD family hydrolase [Planctomycetota bacterium]
MNIILFDIDGTLITTAGAGRKAMERALELEFGVPAPVQRVQMSGRTDRIISSDLLRLHGIEETANTWEQFRDAYLRQLPAHLTSNPGRVLPGIQALLDQLRQMENIAIGLLTGNLREGARLKLSHYGIMHYFSEDPDVNRSLGGFGDTYACRNEVAREALEDVHARFGKGVAGDRVWVIGDTPLDIACARSIGARAVAVGTGDYHAEELAAESPDILLEDLSDPASLLARLM